jgi:hypothetical protein
LISSSYESNAIDGSHDGLLYDLSTDPPLEKFGDFCSLLHILIDHLLDERSNMRIHVTWSIRIDEIYLSGAV